jgi:hypothetical protein
VAALRPESKQRLCPGGRCARRASAGFSTAAPRFPACTAGGMPVTSPPGVSVGTAKKGKSDSVSNALSA